ncbi:ankyrin repeat domain-containing protein 55-like [Epargyreus clarus]|uniref:ankyrin repeat domain-containing protein 55-like n=1 Tax=Epargyreus clarus TaxID=520877 RepID=UPI003C2C546A
MGGGAVLEAAARGDAARLASLLRAQPAHLDLADENGCSALQRAAADGHVEVVRLLLELGADPNKQDHVVSFIIKTRSTQPHTVSPSRYTHLFTDNKKYI